MATPLAKVSRKNFPHMLKYVLNFVDTLSATKHYSLGGQINQTDLLAHTGQELVVPYDGFLEAFSTTTQVAITTGGTTKLQLNTVDIAGATVTQANADAVGTRKTATFTKVAVAAGDRVTLVPAAHATAGALNYVVGFTAN